MPAPDLSPIQRAARIFASSPLRLRVCKVASVAALEQVRRGFERQSDPSDAPWVPLKAATLRRRSTRKKPPPSRSTRILIDRRRLMGSFDVDALSPDGFTIRQKRNTGEPSVRFAYVHQFGNRAGTIPARPMLPEGGTLPPRWEEAMRAAALAVLGDAFGDLGRVA